MKQKALKKVCVSKESYRNQGDITNGAGMSDSKGNKHLCLKIKRLIWV